MLTKSRFCSFQYETRPHKEYAHLYSENLQEQKTNENKMGNLRCIRFLVMICSMILIDLTQKYTRHKLENVFHFFVLTLFDPF